MNTMLNPLSTYLECGQRAARAMNTRDGCRYNMERQWATRAIHLETEGPDRKAAQDAYEEGYRMARVIPNPENFR